MTDTAPSEPTTDKRTKRIEATNRNKIRRQQRAKDIAALGGYPAPTNADPYRARQRLNHATISEMHAAFNKGGKKAIEQVMKNQPAIFLKLLVLLVPRELQIEHRGGVKALTREQIENQIEAIEAYLAKRSGEMAKVIDGATVEAPKRRTPQPRKPVFDEAGKRVLSPREPQDVVVDAEIKAAD